MPCLVVKDALGKVNAAARPAPYRVARYLDRLAADGAGIIQHPQAKDSMNGIDKAFVELQSEKPADQMFIASLFIIDGPPSKTELRSTLEKLCKNNPRFTFKVDQEAAPRCWLPCSVDVADHCVQLHSADDEMIDDDELQDAVGFCMSQVLPLAHRPAWKTYVVPLRSGKCGVVTVLHHAYTDGQGGVGALLSLMSAEGAPVKTWAPTQKSSVIRMNSAKSSIIVKPFIMLLTLLRFIGAILLGAISLSIKTLRILTVKKRTFGSESETCTQKITSWTQKLSLPEVKAMKDALTREEYPNGGGKITINDLMIGLLSASFAELMVQMGTLEKDIFAGVPLSLMRKGPTDLRMANLAVILPLFLPTEHTEPRAAVQSVHRCTMQMKEDAKGEGPLLWALVACMWGLLPPVLKLPFMKFFMYRMSAILTQVPGPRQECKYAGKNIDTFVPFAPAPGRGGLGCAMISHVDGYTLGIYADEAAGDKPRALVEIFTRKFNELRTSLKVKNE